MIPLIVIGALAVLPVFLALILRVNAVFVFLSIAAGYFLQYALSDDVDLVIATVVQGSNAMVAAQFILLCAPVLVTMLLLRRTRGKGLLFQLVPLVFSGMLLATLALPLLPPDMAQQVYDTAYGSGIKQSQDLVIAAAAISNLSLSYVLFKHKDRHGKHR